MQDHKSAVKALNEIRLKLEELMRLAPSPAVERLAQIADVHCHTALWLLGEVQGLTPEGTEAEGQG